MRVQASSRGSGSCPCCCLEPLPAGLSVPRRCAPCRPRSSARGSARRGSDSAFARHNAVHTQVARPHRARANQYYGSECPPASPWAYLLRCSLTLRWGSANQATTCGQAAQTRATCLIVGSIIAGADDGETVCAPACNGRGHAMSPSIGNPHGISAASPLSLERALTGMWRDEAVKRSPARAKAGGRCGDQAALDKPIASANSRMRAPPARLCA
jgi:hypothetical protein